MMWWWFIIEAAAWVILGKSESGTWKRGRFQKHFGVEYDMVLGEDMQNYIRTIYDVSEDWIWQVSLESGDMEIKKYTVKYDDGYGQSGMVEVRFTDSSPAYRRIGPEPGTGGNAF